MTTVTSRLRVLLALGGETANEELFRAIPLLGGSTHLSITGLFVRDANLLRAASLPLAKEVLRSGRVRALSHQQLSDDLNTTATRLRSGMEAAGRRHGYPTTFEVVEGTGLVELVRAAALVDFVVVAPLILRTDARGRAGTLVRQPKTILFVNEPWSSGSSVVVAFENPASDRSLEVGLRYAKDAGLNLVVATPVGIELPDELELNGAERVQISWNENELARLCESRDARLLVLASSDSTDWEHILPELVDRVACSVLRLA